MSDTYKGAPFPGQSTTDVPVSLPAPPAVPPSVRAGTEGETRRMPRLTRREREAVCMVLDEFLAGHDVEMARSAFGLDSEEEGERILMLLSSAAQKLTRTTRSTREKT